MIIMLVWFLCSVPMELLHFVGTIILVFYMTVQLQNGMDYKLYMRLVVVSALSILLLTIGGDAVPS